MTRVAAIQFKAEKGRAEAGLRALVALVDEAAGQGASLIVCPEMATTGYLFTDGDAVRPVAEPARGPGYEALAEVAKRRQCYVVCGYAEETALGRGKDAGARPLYNSARIIGPDGGLLYNYRKRLLFDADFAWAAPGNVPYPRVDTPHGLLTAGICMDLNDDRFTEFLRGSSARIVAFCTNWVDEGMDVWPYWRFRLLGVRSSFVAANTYGWDEAPGQPRTRFSGRSMILSPDGTILASAPKEGDAIVIADVP